MCFSMVEKFTPAHRGERILNNSFLMVFNAHYEMLGLSLLSKLQSYYWQVVIEY